MSTWEIKISRSAYVFVKALPKIHANAKQKKHRHNVTPKQKRISAIMSYLDIENPYYLLNLDFASFFDDFSIRIKTEFAKNNEFFHF